MILMRYINNFGNNIKKIAILNIITITNYLKGKTWYLR